jgi:hypothetical protein
MFFDGSLWSKEVRRTYVPPFSSKEITPTELAVQRNPDVLVERTVSQNGSASGEQADQAGTVFCALRLPASVRAPLYACMRRTLSQRCVPKEDKQYMLHLAHLG